MRRRTVRLDTPRRSAASSVDIRGRGRVTSTDCRWGISSVYGVPREPYLLKATLRTTCVPQPPSRHTPRATQPHAEEEPRPWCVRRAPTIRGAPIATPYTEVSLRRTTGDVDARSRDDPTHIAAECSSGVFDWREAQRAAPSNASRDPARSRLANYLRTSSGTPITHDTPPAQRNRPRI